MAKILRTTAAQMSANAVRRQILDRELHPGSRVTEEALASELGVSRPTIRQALNTLEGEGLLTRELTTRVLKVSILTGADIVDIYRARHVLELAGIDAAADACPERLQPLVEALKRMKDAVDNDDVLELVKADLECHSLTVAFIGSRALSDIHTMLMRRLRLVMTQVEATGQRRSSDVFADHEKFVGLMLRRETDAAKKALKARLEAAEAILLNSLA